MFDFSSTLELHIFIEELVDDPLVSKTTYYGNHKYGLVGVKIDLKNGKSLKITIFPPTL